MDKSLRDTNGIVVNYFAKGLKNHEAQEAQEIFYSDCNGYFTEIIACSDRELFRNLVNLRGFEEDLNKVLSKTGMYNSINVTFTLLSDGEQVRWLIENVIQYDVFRDTIPCKIEGGTNNEA